MASRLRVLFWGTYDLGKPRVRLLMDGAKAAGMEVYECHTDLWKGIEDKSQIFSNRKRITLALKWLFSYPYLILRYLVFKKHDVVIVPYLGHIDIFVIWFFARLRGVLIVWDAFLSLYDTVVNDRALLRDSSLGARLLYRAEWIACRLPHVCMVDTRAQAEYFETLFRLPAGRVKQIPVGVEEQFFQPATKEEIPVSNELVVLFYGQFIPLHGMETIVQAAELVERKRTDVHWIIAGRGQQEGKIEEQLKKADLRQVERIEWIPYQDLRSWIVRADVGLGIFGTSEKSLRVIPNKVFQITSVLRPVVTSDTPAIRELFSDHSAVRLVPPGDPTSLAKTIMELAEQKQLYGRLNPIPAAPVVYNAARIGEELEQILTSNR